jgi:hypothetical protein
MNGTVIFGVAMIIMALFTAGAWFFTLLIGGVAVAAFGAFTPTKPAAGRKPPPLDDDRFV